MLNSRGSKHDLRNSSAAWLASVARVCRTVLALMISALAQVVLLIARIFAALAEAFLQLAEAMRPRGF